MSHYHDIASASQNVGNVLGDRACVRQSKLYREYESGNQTKSLLGQDNLVWDTNKKQGFYEGQKVFDHNEGHQSAAAGERIIPRDISTRVTNCPLRESNTDNIVQDNNNATTAVVGGVGTVAKGVNNSQELLEKPTKTPAVLNDHQNERNRTKDAYDKIRTRNTQATSLW